MASGIFAVLDDIASLMDDVAVASKIATKKTAGILGDDLAVNTEKATGYSPSRELPVLWAITKGSLLNKVIIIPIAIVLNLFLPAAITYILILGGIYLAYEGAEKIYEFLFHRSKKHHSDTPTEQATPQVDLQAEKAKIKSAIITDFILSIEIVIIGLSSVLHESLTVQVITVTIVAIIATVGVYGLVALIVRMDDAGYKLIAFSKNKGALFALGKGLVKALPLIIKFFSFVGTIALLLVSGGIFVHQIDYFHHILPGFTPILKEFLFGTIIGFIALPIITIVIKVVKKKK